MYDYLAGRDRISNFHASPFLFSTNYIGFKLPATTLYIIDNIDIANCYLYSVDRHYCMHATIFDQTLRLQLIFQLLIFETLRCTWDN
jgi:hypothetical protein